MYKCTCKVVVLLIKPLVFLTFSLPSASLDLKVPINHNDDNNDNAKKNNWFYESSKTTALHLYHAFPSNTFL